MFRYCCYCNRVLVPSETFLTADFVKDGPDAPGKHATCYACYVAKAYAMRARCQNCGILRSLLWKENNSQTTSWVVYRIGNDHCRLCGECRGLVPTVKNRFTGCVPLEAHEIELLRTFHKRPGWQRETRMPLLHRDIDAEWG